MDLFRRELIQAYPLRLLSSFVVENHQVRVMSLDVIDAQVSVGVRMALFLDERLDLLELV